MRKNILVIQTAFIGDALLAIPLLRETRKRFPDCQIELLYRKGLGSFFLNFGLINTFFEIDKANSADRTLVHQKLISKTYDVVICPHQSIRTSLLVRQLTSPIKIGFDRVLESGPLGLLFSYINRFIYTHRVSRDEKLPDALRQLSLLSSLDSDSEGVEGVQSVDQNSNSIDSVTFEASEALNRYSMDLTGSDQLFDAKSPQVARQSVKYICIAPGSVWPTKRWLAESWKEVISAVIENNIGVVILGGPDDIDYVSGIVDLLEDSGVRVSSENSFIETEFSEGVVDIVSAFDQMRTVKVLDLVGKCSLIESRQIMNHSRLVVSCDSGAMHLASTTRVPVVGLFGPTTLKLGYRPWTKKSSVIQKPLECRPCGKHGAKKCPLGTHDCMKQVLPKDVLNSIYYFLQ